MATLSQGCGEKVAALSRDGSLHGCGEKMVVLLRGWLLVEEIRQQQSNKTKLLAGCGK